MLHFPKIKPWHRIALISEPATPKPSWFSKVIPDVSTTNGYATGGEIGDFATLINLWPIIGFHIEKQVFFRNPISNFHIYVKFTDLSKKSKIRPIRFLVHS